MVTEDVPRSPQKGSHAGDPISNNRALGSAQGASCIAVGQSSTLAEQGISISDDNARFTREGVMVVAPSMGMTEISGPETVSLRSSMGSPMVCCGPMAPHTSDEKVPHTKREHKADGRSDSSVDSPQLIHHPPPSSKNI